MAAWPHAGSALWLVIAVLSLAACNPVPRIEVPNITTQPVTATLTLQSSPVPSQTPTLEPIHTSTMASPASLPTATVRLPEVIISAQNASRLEQLAAIRYDPWELVLALAWSPDGNLLAVSAGNAIYLYAGSDLGQLQILQVSSWTSGLAFSPDGSTLATGSRDGELRIWRKHADGHTFEAQPAIQWTAHKKGINQVAFSPNGLYLASGGNDAIARVWRTEDGGLEQQMIGGTFSVPALAFQPNGLYQVVVNGPLARFRALETGRIGTTLRGEVPLFSLAFSPDGRWIVTGNLDNQLEIWEVDTGNRVARLDAPSPAPGAPAAFSGQVMYSPVGNLLAATASDGSIRLWDPVSGQLAATLIGHDRAATCLAFNPDQSRLVSGGLDATVRIWGVP